MKMSRAIAVPCTTAIVFSLFAIAKGQERKIQRSALPPAVEKTVAEQSNGATIRGLSREKENGQIYYEAELMVDGRTKDILVDANGSVVEVEEQVSTESLPAAIRRGLQAKAGKGRLFNVETLTKKGKLVAYEAKVLTNGKMSEVQVGPDGRDLVHAE